MRWQNTFVALVAAFSMFPGAAEIGENVVHLVTSGHLAHELEDADHERQGTEHGCSGTAHLCSCCTAPLFVPSAPPRPPTAISRCSMPAPSRMELTPDGHLPGVFRPPIA